ncbi:hypothetical protein HGRIS_004812 [Hohenbuehelia grisea]|uniref:Symplekin n=1 Tax=Hohenbuehelia grisea TaxID=104357 RepID=A0ABR3JD96_9AGAR
MASNPGDTLNTLAAALKKDADSQEQADLLTAVREQLEAHPTTFSILGNTLLGMAMNHSGTLFRTWALDTIHYGLCRSPLSHEVKANISLQCLDTLSQCLYDPNPSNVKIVVQIFTTVYPLLFRVMCTNRANPVAWETLSQCKARILEFVWSPAALGIKLCAMKFMQRAILVQSRGVPDPRLQNKNDPNLSFCPADHPFISVAKLEAEGHKLLEGVITLFYTSQNVDLLSATLNSWATLTKLRPALVQLIITTLKQWTPAALAGQSASNIKSVEKAVRIFLIHISRYPGNGQYAGLINEALAQQGIRMDQAAAEEKRRKVALAESRKRPISASAEQADAKRPKLEPEAGPSSSTSAEFLSSFDFTTLPATLITDLIVANMAAFTEVQINDLVMAYRQTHLGPTVAQQPVPAAPVDTRKSATPVSSGPAVPVMKKAPPTAPRAMTAASAATSTPVRAATPPPPPPPPPPVKEEPVDPLQMDIDQEEIEYEPDRLNEELSGGVAAGDGDDTAIGADIDPASLDLGLLEFKLPPPHDLSEAERTALLQGSVERIWAGAEEEGAGSITPGSSDMWMLLLVRTLTRVTEPPKSMRDRSQSSDGAEPPPGTSVDQASSSSTDGEKGKGKAKDDGGGDADEAGVMEGSKGSSDESSLDDFYARQDRLRQTLCDYIMADFSSRIRLASTWMNEEWYNDRIRLAKDHNWRSNYDTWLQQIVVSYQTLLDGKDRTFSRFLLDLPSIPPDVFGLLRDLCLDVDSPERMQVGFATLRGFVVHRPSLRTEALNTLLELTTHPDKKSRGAAINTVKTWVPHSQPMDTMIREFALQMLRKLQLHPSVVPKTTPVVKTGDSDADGIPEGQDSAEKADVEMEGGSGESSTAEAQPSAQVEPTVDNDIDATMDDEDGQLPADELVQTPYLPDRIELPADKGAVLQHVELLFALSVKVPNFLDEIFVAYGQMDATVQEAIQQLITALIRSLGPNHGKLLTLMRQLPPGAETLALRVLTIFTEHGRPSAQLVALVKSLLNERDLDARFLIPIIAEMDKADIIKYLPRIVSILNGEAEPKNLVRSVFSSVVTTPPQTFGSVTSNLPRVRQSELLTPAELMVLLHESEKEIGLKSAIEAIGICFSMTDVFRSEILAVVMQQIMDEPVLPVLFLRTVIQAVKTYKSLIGFVSTTLLSRLITKKIWTNPPLWEGFIRCAKVIAPASFGALLQLPKDQLRELVDKQPSLKSGLRDFVTKNSKAPANKARVAGLLDIFGDGEESQGAAPNGGSPVPATPPPQPEPSTAAAPA